MRAEVCPWHESYPGFPWSKGLFCCRICSVSYLVCFSDSCPRGVAERLTQLCSDSCLLTLLPLVVQSLSCVQLFVIPWPVAHQASLAFTVSRSLLKLTSIESVIPSNHIILYHPLLLLPSIFPSIRVFPNELTLHIRRPKYWSSSFSISPANEYSELISFRIDWFDLAVPGTSRVFSSTAIRKHQFFGA